MKYTTFCASDGYPNRMSGWLEVSFGADQGGKDRFCQLRQRVVDAHVFAYRGICARCTMASRINTRWQPPVTNFPPTALFKMLRYSVKHRGEQLDLVIQRLLSTLKLQFLIPSLPVYVVFEGRAQDMFHIWSNMPRGWKTHRSCFKL